MGPQDKTHEESRAGDGVELSVTDARAGERRGLSKVLVISTALAVVALAAAWFVMPRHASVAHAPAQPTMTGQANP